MNSFPKNFNLFIYSKLHPKRSEGRVPGNWEPAPVFRGSIPQLPRSLSRVYPGRTTSSLAKPVPHLMRELVRTQEYLRASEPSAMNQALDNAISEYWQNGAGKKLFIFLLKT